MMADMWNAMRDAERLLIAAEANDRRDDGQDDAVEESRPGLLGRLLAKKAA